LELLINLNFIIKRATLVALFFWITFYVTIFESK